MLAYGVASVVSTLLSNHAEQRRVSREALVGIAAVLQLGLLVFLLVWIPDINLVGVFVAVSALSGICDGFWITQCTCEYISHPQIYVAVAWLIRAVICPHAAPLSSVVRWHE